MYARKSDELIERALQNIKDKKISVTIKNDIDNRYEKDYICSHDYLKDETKKIKATFQVKKLDILLHNPTFYKLMKNDTTIYIDEGHFFEDLFDFIRYIKMLSNKVKICVAGLDLNYELKWFPNIKKCIDEIEGIKANCDFCNEIIAEYSYIKKNIQKIETFLVGGTETYGASCKQCYYLTKK